MLPYKDIPALNQSRLFQILRAPYYFKNYRSKGTKSTEIGDLVHLVLLEPEKAKATLRVRPDYAYEIRKSGKILQCSLEEFPGCEKVDFNNKSSTHRDLLVGYQYISSDDLEMIQIVSENVQKNERASYWLKHGKKEVILTSPLFGIDCKGLVDILGSDFKADLKTTDSIASFDRSAIKYGYDFQEAFYDLLAEANGYKIKERGFILVENKYPYAVTTGEFDEAFRTRGLGLVKKAFDIYHDCVAQGLWLPPEHKVISPPGWSVSENIGEENESF